MQNQPHQPVHVFILAAGKGARMRQSLPKPLTVVAGVPLIDRMIDAVRGAFGEHWSIVVGHGANAIRAHLGNDVTDVYQRTRKGTGHALKIALKGLPKSLPDYLVVIPGNFPLLTSTTLRELFQKSVDSGAPITVATAIAPGDFLPDNPFWFSSRVVRGLGGGIRRIVALKDADRDERAIHEVDTGCYVFNTRWVLERITKLHPVTPSREYRLSDLVGIAAIEGTRVAAHQMSNWREALSVNTQEDLRFVEEILLGKIVSY